MDFAYHPGHVDSQILVPVHGHGGHGQRQRLDIEGLQDHGLPAVFAADFRVHPSYVMGICQTFDVEPVALAVSGPFA